MVYIILYLFLFDVNKRHGILRTYLDRQTDDKTNTNRRADRHRHTNRQEDRQTGRQTDIEKTDRNRTTEADAQT